MKLNKSILLFIIATILLFSSCVSDKITYDTTKIENPDTEPITDTIEETLPESQEILEEIERSFIVNKITKKYHNEDCRYVGFMNEENKLFITSTPEKLQSQKYKPCSHCQK